ncbi:MAG: trypsin-like peptidase domain-containing protein [bacterium]|nr:trypsin-like peptidase domain-containing protein [bacterium]
MQRKLSVTALLGATILMLGIAMRVTAQEALTRDSYKNAVKIASPSVVTIEVRIPHEFSVTDPTVNQRGSRATGSGIIADALGHIITNKHVVNGGKILDATITLADGKSFSARLLGVAPDTDIAIMLIDTPQHTLTPAKFGDDSAIQAGEIVIAIGAPHGLQNTVTHGIISNAARVLESTIQDDVPSHKLIQTDASINPGNSGGPLATLDGAVIGINTLIFTAASGGGSIGLGFAIPIDVALRAFDRIRSGNISLGWIGIGVEDISNIHRQAFDIDQNAACVVVTTVDASGPAAGKLRQGDCITTANGRMTNDAVEFRAIVSNATVGSTLALNVQRGKNPPLHVDIAVAKKPSMP